MKRVVLLLPVLALFYGCEGGGKSGAPAPPPPPPPVLIDMDQVLEDFVAGNPNVPSATLLAVKDGEVVYSHGAGFADAAMTRAPTESTLYRTSSIAKLVIAVAVMQQVELGRLDLDADVGDYLPFPVRNPAFPDTPITARMLMKHSAGLTNPDPGESTDKIFEVWDPSVVVQLAPLIDDVLTPGSADYVDAVWLPGEPGSTARNSNLSMLLLVYLVEQLSGMHYIDYAKAFVFLPLGMTGTSHYFPDLDANEVAPLYNASNGHAPASPTANYFYPISGLFTSTGDWANFLRAILAGGTFAGNRILEPASVDAMLEMTTPANNQLAYGSNIGLIWREAAANPGWYGHTGAGSQVTNVTELNPARQIGYVLFVNEGLIDGQVGPGSDLNRTIHRWLDQL